MQPINEGITFNHMDDDKEQKSLNPAPSEILLFLAEETLMVALMLSMIFLM